MIPRLCLFLLTLLCCLSLGACSKPVEKPLRLGTNLWIGYEPFYLARELNALDQQKIKLIEYSTSIPVIDAMRNGLIDAAALTLDESIVLQQQVKDLRIIAVLDFSNGADVLLAKQDIGSIDELRGKRIAVENLASGGYLLSRGLEKVGLRIQDVEVVPLAADKHEAALQQADIAAIVSYQPMATRLQNGGAHRLFDSSQIPGEIIDVLAVREKTLAEQPDNLRYVLQAWFIGQQHLQRNQPEAIQKMQRRQQLTPTQIQATLRELRFPLREENHKLLSYPTMLTNTSRLLQNHMRHNGLLAGKTPPQSLAFDARWLTESP